MLFWKFQKMLLELFRTTYMLYKDLMIMITASRSYNIICALLIRFNANAANVLPNEVKLGVCRPLVLQYPIADSQRFHSLLDNYLISTSHQMVIEEGC